MNSGEIVLVKFPFSDLETVKKRPALVLFKTSLTAKAHLVTIAMITSKTDGLKLKGDVLLDQWQKSNLLHPSLIRLSKIATVDGELIEKKLGTLGEDDFQNVKKMIGSLFKYWI